MSYRNEWVGWEYGETLCPENLDGLRGMLLDRTEGKWELVTDTQLDISGKIYLLWKRPNGEEWKKEQWQQWEYGETLDPENLDELRDLLKDCAEGNWELITFRRITMSGKHFLLRRRPS